MIYQAILTASLFLLLAFGIEHLGRWSGIPSVVILIVTGLVGRPALNFLGIEFTGLDTAVPVIGTIGLILIVLEGAFEIELRRDRVKLAAWASLSAVVGLLICMFLFALLASIAFNLTLVQSLLVAIPFSVISSAVAIPSSSFLPLQGREFIVYESSISDILGILFFFTVLNSDGSVGSIFSSLMGDGLLSILLGAVCAIALLLILLRIEGHVRFTPLLATLFALYAVGKLWHLSPLLMVLLFGLAINNLRLFTRLPVLRGLLDNEFEKTLAEFKSLTTELTFAVRGFFFIILGYWTDWTALADPVAWLIAVVVLAVIFFSRSFWMRLARIGMGAALTWIAPRGLITVLLFLSAKETLELPSSMDGAVLLVVFASALMVAVGRILWSKQAPPPSPPNETAQTEPETGLVRLPGNPAD